MTQIGARIIIALIIRWIIKKNNLTLQENTFAENELVQSLSPKFHDNTDNSSRGSYTNWWSDFWSTFEENSQKFKNFANLDMNMNFPPNIINQLNSFGINSDLFSKETYEGLQKINSRVHNILTNPPNQTSGHIDSTYNFDFNSYERINEPLSKSLQNDNFPKTRIQSIKNNKIVFVEPELSSININKVTKSTGQSVNIPDENMVEDSNIGNTGNNSKIKNDGKNSRSSKYRGVSKNGNQWQVLIMANKEKKYIGSYTTELEAARAYDKVALQSHGHKAKTNFDYTPDEIKQIQNEYRNY